MGRLIRIYTRIHYTEYTIIPHWNVIPPEERLRPLRLDIILFFHPLFVCLFVYLCGKYVTSKPSFQCYRTTQHHRCIIEIEMAPKTLHSNLCVSAIVFVKHVTHTHTRLHHLSDSKHHKFSVDFVQQLSIHYWGFFCAFANGLDWNVIEIQNK